MLGHNSNPMSSVADGHRLDREDFDREERYLNNVVKPYTQRRDT